GGEVTVRPIAGTCARGRTHEEDELLAARLLADEKERAGHMMLVDLGRNDVGRVARFGSVRVTDLLQVERYSHVQHLVSEVRGKLRDGYDALDVFKACFPAGTVTGAPKVRAMEIIDELEPERRGPYAGAVGDVGGGAAGLDTATGLRAAVGPRGQVLRQAGARSHAEVSLTDGGVKVKDVGSSNGTFLNGARITEAIAGENDVITFGKVAFRVKEVTAPAPRPKVVPPLPSEFGAKAGSTILRQL